MRQIFVGFFPVGRAGDGRVVGFFQKILIGSLLFHLFFNTSFAAQGEIKQNFDIPSQPLSMALLAFGEQSNLSLLVRKKYTDGKVTKRLKGYFYPSEALWRLLKDMELGFEYSDPKTISLSPELINNAPWLKSSPPQATAPVIEDDPQDMDYQDVVDEVIVTALRRMTNMQKVPVAVSVLKPPMLREARIYDLEDVGTRVPGLTIASFSLGQPTIHVRGVGSNDDGAALDNSIVMFVDDVYVGRITAISMSFFDLERIEVIRGPQGTLYGKNAIGGAINVTSRAPTEQLTGEVEMTIGNYGRIDLRSMISGPLVENKILGRLAFHSKSRNGWQESLFLPGVKQNEEKTWSGRGKLLFLLNDNLTVDLNGDYTRDDMDSTGRIPVVGRVPVRLLGPDGNPTGEKALPTDIFKSLGGSVKKAINSDRGFTDRTIWGLSSRASLTGNFGEILSITAYRESNFSWLEDSTGLPSSVTDQKVNSNVNERHSQFSQEIRWLSPNEVKVKYVLGLYYLYERTHRIEKFVFPKGLNVTDQNNITNSFAAFGEATYAFRDDLFFTMGARLTYETKDMNQRSDINGFKGILLEDFSLENKGNWTDFSPNFVLSWQQTADVMWYGSISRGYKSGGFQGAPATLELARRTIDPESVWNFELGYKSQWFEDRLRLNLVGFYSDYRDLQVVQFKTEGNFGVFQTSNAASASLRGIEMEFAVRPLAGLELSGSYAFLEATYDDFNDLSGRDFTGNTLRQAPRHSLYLSLYYERPVYKGRLRLRADYRYQGESYREPDNAVTIQPAFDLVDASIAFESDNNIWEVTLWAKNLLNEEYISHLYVLGGNDYALFGTPRTYGLTVTLNF